MELDNRFIWAANATMAAFHDRSARVTLQIFGTSRQKRERITALASLGLTSWANQLGAKHDAHEVTFD
ncbi:hypothetical protein [Paraburkholderia sp. EG304]|uniref:hypothetical protein n=1 Tax=Paraburkholderia sp. EG304 TaxID=3237015 RepID=UPI00397AB331